MLEILKNLVNGRDLSWFDVVIQDDNNNEQVTTFERKIIRMVKLVRQRLR